MLIKTIQPYATARSLLPSGKPTASIEKQFLSSIQALSRLGVWQPWMSPTVQHREPACTALYKCRRLPRPSTQDAYPLITGSGTERPKYTDLDGKQTDLTHCGRTTRPLHSEAAAASPYNAHSTACPDLELQACKRPTQQLSHIMKCPMVASAWALQSVTHTLSSNLRQGQGVIQILRNTRCFWYVTSNVLSVADHKGQMLTCICAPNGLSAGLTCRTRCQDKNACLPHLGVRYKYKKMSKQFACQPQTVALQLQHKPFFFFFFFPPFFSLSVIKPHLEAVTSQRSHLFYPCSLEGPSPLLTRSPSAKSLLATLP